ncbi:MAG: methyl-accepting chemotaxis protein, partial [Eubacterium sp.]|nr:methyl-accepting chemotaxis protein [Eubacterium sp.]
MKNLKVSSKLIIGFLIIAALSIVVGGAGIIGLSSMAEGAIDMYESKASPLEYLVISSEYFQRLRVQIRNAIIYTGDQAQLDTIEDDIYTRFETFESSMDNYFPTILTDEGKALQSEIMEQYDNVMKPGILFVLEGARQGKTTAELMSDLSETIQAADIIAANIDGLTTLRMKVMQDANDANLELERILLLVIIGVIIVALIVSVLLALYISGLISKPIKVLTRFMKKAGTSGDITLQEEDAKYIKIYGTIKDEIGDCITSTARFVKHISNIAISLGTVSGGDLSEDIHALSQDDVMGLSLTKMNDSLNNMFGEVHTSTSQVSGAAKQIADAAQTLAQGSTEQAATVEQLSSSITLI